MDKELVKELCDALREALFMIGSELSGELDMTVPDPDPEEIEEVLDKGWEVLEKVEMNLKG